MNRPKTSEFDANMYAALIGIDWATCKHDIWVYDCTDGQQSYQVIKHSPESLIAWITQLRKKYRNKPVAICLEQSRGALINALLGYEFIHLYPINPATLAKFRQAFTPSRAKSDPADAELLMELLLKHGDRLKHWEPDDQDTRTLALLCEQRRTAVNWRTRLIQRLKSTLTDYFPQALDLFCNNVSSDLACDFIQKWPTLQDAKRARAATLRAFYYAHNYRRGDLIEEHVESIGSAVPLTEDQAVITSSIITAKALARQIQDINSSIKQYDQAVLQLYKNHPDAFIFQSLPGAGPALGPRLLAALGTKRDRYDKVEELQSHSGIAPVTECSGKAEWIHWRWSCPTFMRQSFHEFANCSRRFSPWAYAFYEQQRQRGKSHHAAIRSLAFKWQRIIFRCWKEHEPYDEERYTAALKAHGSTLLKEA